MDTGIIIDLTAIAVALTVLATLANGVEKVIIVNLKLQRTILKIYENQKIIDYRLTMLENRFTQTVSYEPAKWLDVINEDELEK